MIRHTNGAAPSNYKPHGQLYSPKYDASKIKATTYASTAPETVTSQPPVQISSNPVNVLDTATIQQQTPGTQNNAASGGSSAAPASEPASSASTPESTPTACSAPITESSNPAMSEKVKAVYNLIPASIRKDYKESGKGLIDDIIRDWNRVKNEKR